MFGFTAIINYINGLDNVGNYNPITTCYNFTTNPLLFKLSTKFSKQEMESYASAGAVAEEVLTSIRTVVAFDGQNKEIDRYNEHLLTAKKNNIKKSFFNSISNGVMWFFTFANFALSFWYGVTLIIDEADLPPEDVIYTPGNMISVSGRTLNKRE